MSTFIDTSAESGDRILLIVNFLANFNALGELNIKLVCRNFAFQRQLAVNG